jgi:hypothetical protein
LGDILSVLMMFALDECCCEVVCLAESSYRVSDGVAGKVRGVKEVVSGCALRIGWRAGWDVESWV